MKKASIRLIHIQRCRGVTRRIIRRMYKQDSSLEQIYSLSSSQLSHLFSIPFNNAKIFHQDLHDERLRKQIIIDVRTYKIITIMDESYPDHLKKIQDPPLVLYMMGDCSLLSYTPALSVIGTRNPTAEASSKVNRIIQPLIEKDWLIVSGMAKGIDGYAHQSALRHDGKTIAVLGAGFEHIYPKQHIALFHKIKNKGLIISEYPPQTPPKKFHFPERNRIISGLSFGTLVIEATERSGTMITVDQALDQGREVYAMPGSPLVPQTKGCHQMIQDGAKLVTEAEDILVDWETMARLLFY